MVDRITRAIIKDAVFLFLLLKSLLESCGIRNVKRIIKGYKGIPFVRDCLHVTGIKS